MCVTGTREFALFAARRRARATAARHHLHGCASSSPAPAASSARCSSPACSRRATRARPRPRRRRACARRSSASAAAGAARGSARCSAATRSAARASRRRWRAFEVAYYLIHSMESAAGRGATSPSASGSRANNFAGRRRHAGVRRIVYLGGLDRRQRAGRPLARISRAAWRSRQILLAARARLARAARLDRDRRALALLPAAGAPGRAHAGARTARLAELPHPADRRARRDRDARPRCATPEPRRARWTSAGPDVLTYGEMLARDRRRDARRPPDGEDRR